MLRWAVCLVFAQLTLLVGAMEKPASSTSEGLGVLGFRVQGLGFRV